jgi:hypothetical protein
MKSLNIVFFAQLVLISSSMHAVIIITYNTPDDAILNRVDFSLGTDRIDPIKEAGDDDFNRQGPFGTISYGQPTGDIKIGTENNAVLMPDRSTNYNNYFDKVVYGSTDKKELQVDDFNIYSGHSFQLSSLPSDFTLSTDMYSADPQLNSIIDYYVDSVKIESGQRQVVQGQDTILQIYNKDEVAFGGTITNKPLMFQITCPTGKRVEFDVNEIRTLPTNQITFRTKGCVITNRNIFAITGA